MRDPDDFPGTPNRRSEPRHKAKFLVIAEAGSDYPVIPCEILNLSESGAHVAPVDDSAVLPDAFTMKVADNELLWEARVVWRRGHTAGVKMKQRTSE